MFQIGKLNQDVTGLENMYKSWVEHGINLYVCNKNIRKKLLMDKYGSVPVFRPVPVRFGRFTHEKKSQHEVTPASK